MNENYNDIDASRGVLREIADLCEHATLTGSLSGGAVRVARRYNSILSQFIESGRLPPDLFEILPEDAPYGEVGAEARMLSAFLRKENKEKGKSSIGDPSVLLRLAPFVRPDDLAKLVHQQMEGGVQIDMDLVTHLAPFLNQDTLSEILQEHIRTRRAPPEPTPPSPPEPPAPPTGPLTTALEYADRTPHRVPEADDRLLVLLDRLKDPGVSHEDRADLIERIKALTA